MGIENSVKKINFKSNFNSLLNTSKSTNYNLNTSTQKYDATIFTTYNLVNNIVLSPEIDPNKYSFNTKYDEIKKDGYTTQGLTKIDGKTYLSAYGKNESRVYIYDENDNYIGHINLDQSSHVGGMTFDEENNILYVTNGGGKYSTYNMVELNQIINNDSNKENGILDIDLTPTTGISKEEFKNTIAYSNDENLIKLLNEEGIDSLYDDWKENYNDEKYANINTQLEKTHSLIIENDIEARCTSSTTYFHDGLLYTCKFEGTEEGKMDVLRPIMTEKDGKPFITYEKVYEEPIDIPSRTQGIAVTEYNGKEYILFSRSTGPFKSNITVWEKDSNGNYINIGERNYDLGGMEGIYIDENNQITACFEFEDKTMTMSMDTLLSELRDKNDPRDVVSRFILKAGGAFWDSDGNSTLSDAGNRWNDLIKDESIFKKPERFVTATLSSIKIVSLVPLTLEKLVIPKAIKKIDIADGAIEVFEDVVQDNLRAPFDTMVDEIDDKGLLNGGLTGAIKTGYHVPINGLKTTLKTGTLFGEGIAMFYNKHTNGPKIDLKVFKEARGFITTGAKVITTYADVLAEKKADNFKKNIDRFIKIQKLPFDVGYRLGKETFKVTKKGYNAAVDFTEDRIDDVVNGGKTAIKWTKKGYNNAVDFTEDRIEDVVDGGKTAIKWSKKGYDSAVDFTEDRIDDVVNWSKKGYNKAEDYADDFFDTADDLKDDFVDGCEDAWDDFTDFLGV